MCRGLLDGDGGQWRLPQHARGGGGQCRSSISARVAALAVKSVDKVYLRSANRHQLVVPRCRLNTYGRRAFSIAGPMVWNSLPDELRDPACGSDSFKQFLKTILFSLN